MSAHGESHGTEEKKIKSSDVVKKIFYIGAVLILIFLIIIPFFKKCDGPKKDKDKVTKNYEEVTPDIEGTTPFSPTFDWPFAIKADGPIYEKFPGIPEPVYFDSKDNINTPVEGRQAGPVEITSADPDNPHVRVRIYRK